MTDRQTNYAELFDAVREHWWRAGKRRILRYLLSESLDVVHSERRILDAGSGDGWNFSTLAEFGEVVGLESDPDVWSTCRETYPSIEVYNLGVGDALDETFDVICVFDVLEHLSDDARAGAWFFDHLRPHGWLFVTVPAFQFLWTSHDVKWGHYRRYTASSLRSLLSPWFDSKRMTYYNTHLFPLAVASTLLDRVHPGASSGEGTSKAGAINSVLREIFASELFWLKHMNLPLGVSLYASFRRKS